MRNRFRFMDSEYTFGELIKLRAVSPLYKEGYVTDLQTGEDLDISEIDKWRELYIGELMSSREKDVASNISKSKLRKQILSEKYANETIKKHELLELIKLINTFDDGRKHLQLYYDNFYTVNMDRDKPKEISDSDYGKFFRMLNFIAQSINAIQHKSNGKKIKELDLSRYLGFSNIRAFNNYLSKLNKHNLIAKGRRKNDKFIHINPIYAQRRIKIDQTLYDLFKDDLQEYLSEYEIKYFEMDESEECLPSTIFLE